MLANQHAVSYRQSMMTEREVISTHYGGSVSHTLLQEDLSPSGGHQIGFWQRCFCVALFSGNQPTSFYDMDDTKHHGTFVRLLRRTTVLMKDEKT